MTKIHEDLEKERPAEKLHDIIRNTLLPPLKTVMNHLERADTVEEVISDIEKMEHRLNGMKHGLRFAIKRENGNND